MKLYRETKERLDKLKEHPKESYDEVIKKLLFILNTLKKDPQHAQRTLSKIDTHIKQHEQYTAVYDEKKDKKVEANEK